MGVCCLLFVVFHLFISCLPIWWSCCPCDTASTSDKVCQRALHQQHSACQSRPCSGIHVELLGSGFFRTQWPKGGPKEPREWTQSDPNEPNGPREPPKEPSHTERVVIIRRKEKRRGKKTQTANYNRVSERFEKRKSHLFKKGCSAVSCTCIRFPFFHGFSTTTFSTNIWTQTITIFHGFATTTTHFIKTWNSIWDFQFWETPSVKHKLVLDISKKNKKCSGEAQGNRTTHRI